VEEIQFLTVDQVLEIHRRLIEKYGGATGLRDEGLLTSAVMTPQQTFGGEYLYPTLAAMAAAYWHGLVCNHAFVDGNKRVGLLATHTFLEMNGLSLNLSNDQAEEVTLKLASHQVTREALIASLTDWT
jgi:death-on-curing protein